MSDNYSQGTVSVQYNSNVVRGVGTYFKTIGLIEVGSLFTVDDHRFYRITAVVSNTEIRIESPVAQLPYQESGASDISYTIVKQFARQTNLGLASDFIAFQNELLQQKYQFHNWVFSLDNNYEIPDGEGSTKSILTPVGLQALIADLADGEIGGGYGDMSWSSVSGKPDTATRWPTFAEVTDKPSTYTPSAHSHDWGSILNAPETATRWPTYGEITGDINEFLPTTAKRWPAFEEVTGEVAEEQLPQKVRPHKRDLKLSPKMRRKKNINQILADYPSMKVTEATPTESPNSKKEILIDDVRELVHVSLSEKWFTIPTVKATRAFPVFYRGLILRFNNSSAYTGDITMRVYPMGNGGLGLPNNPTLADHQWHEFTTSVTDLYKIGEFNSEYFEGIIDYVALDTGWHKFDVEQSNVASLNAKFDVAFGTLRSPFRQYSLKDDGHWYSEDMFPSNLNEIGAGWQQDPVNPRLFEANDLTSGTDALRFFNDGYDDYQFELIVNVINVTHTLALTVDNSDPNRVYYEGAARFVTEGRIYFKRGGSSLTNVIIEVESLKMRIPNYG